MKIACFGLGSMGYGMADSLRRAGHEVLGIDPNATAEDRFRTSGGLDGDLTEHSGTLDAVVIVVLNAQQTREVLLEITKHLRPGTAVMSCATVSPDFAREMAGLCEDAELLYLDAPISGGSVKAAEGQLSIMASGSNQAFAALGPVLKATAGTVFELAEDPGTGSAMKAINQMLAGIHIAAMGEALTFGMTQGIDPAKTIEVISKCAGTSWMFENRGRHVASGDYTPHSSVNIWPKDLGIVLEIAQEAKFGAPLTTAALQQFRSAAESGLGREDDAAVAKVYARNAGLTLPGKATSPD